MFNLHLIGVDCRGLERTDREAIDRSTCVFATERFKGLLGNFQGEVLPISPLAEALELMAARLTLGDITVLASGDPLFFGIGRTLLQRFGSEGVIVHPALSSMQLAFAHFKEPWQDAAFISLHGRGGQDILPALLRQGKVFLFTDQRHRPETVAAAIAAGLDELGLADLPCRIMVAENLGLENERIVDGSPQQIAGQCFADLNVMIVALSGPFGAVPFDSAQGTEGATATVCSLSGVEGRGKVSLGLKEVEITHSRGLITKDEVRAAILHGLRLPPTGVFWDIGAGSGSVSCEAARLCPELTVYAIEQHPDEQANIMANRKSFRLANLHLVRGQAPGAVCGLPAPDRVFIGGSGGQLPAIVETVSSRLKTHGIIMASAVTLATRQSAPNLFHQQGLRVAMTTIAVSRDTYPPQTDGPLTLNPITIVTGTK